MNPNPPPPPNSFPVETTSWWQRNKKWALPVGCVGLFIVLGCCGALGAATYFGKQGIDFLKEQGVKMAPVEAEARARIEQSPELQERLGSPVVVGMRTGFNAGVHNGAVKITFSYQVSGPRGQGVVSGEARAPDTSADLALSSLEADVGGDTIDLMGGPPPSMGAPGGELPMDEPTDEPMDEAPTE